MPLQFEFTEDKKAQFVALTHSQYAIHALDFLFARPIFASTNFSSNSKSIPPPMAKRIIAILRENGILKVLREASGRRPAIYALWELLNVAEGKTVF